MITKRTFTAVAAAALLIAASGMAAAQTEPVDGDTTVNMDGGPAPTEDITGSFDRLSPGNQKIARSLFDGQTLNGNGETEAWSLDKIAATKQSGEGWGQVFKQMKAEGLTDARNLGQVVSGHYQPATTSTTTSSEIVITTGSNRQISTGRQPKASAATGPTDHGRGGNDRIRVTNASGNGKTGVISAAGKGGARGNAYGHAVTAGGASASAGVTSGAGRGIGNGAGHSGSGSSGRALGHYK